MMSIQDERGYNQIYNDTKTNLIRSQRRNDYFKKGIDGTKPERILEIGCGLGRLSAQLAENPFLQVTGVDISARFITLARELSKSNLNFQQLDFYQFRAFPNETFDYIVGNGILHHLYPRLDEALARIHVLLKKNGKILFLEPNLLNPICYLIFNTWPFFRNLARLEPTEKAFTKRFISKKLKGTGFKKVRVECRDFLTPITPTFLIQPTIIIGDFFEKIPLIKNISQSLFIQATKM